MRSGWDRMSRKRNGNRRKGAADPEATDASRGLKAGVDVKLPARLLKYLVQMEMKR